MVWSRCGQPSYHELGGLQWGAWATATATATKTSLKKWIRAYSISFSSSTGSKLAPFSFNCHDASKFVLVSVYSLIKTIWPKLWAKLRPKNENSPLLVDVHRSKTSLFKLTNMVYWRPSLLLTYRKSPIKLPLSNKPPYRPPYYYYSLINDRLF